jgi:hypothetical protein
LFNFYSQISHKKETECREFCFTATIADVFRRLESFGDPMFNVSQTPAWFNRIAIGA